MRAEGMLDRLAANAHRLRILVEPFLHSLEHVLILPSRDPALRARGALIFDGAASGTHSSSSGAASAVLLVRIVELQPLAGRAE